MSPEKNCNIVFVGDAGVGKTAFVRRLIDGKFHSTYFPTFAVNVHSRTPLPEVDGSVSFNLWDIGGSEAGGSRDRYFANADAVVVMFSVDSLQSFKNVGLWIKRTRRSCPDVPIVLCATKVDARDRVVLSGEIQRVFPAETVIETSAKTGFNLHEPLRSALCKLAVIEEANAPAADVSDDATKFMAALAKNHMSRCPLPGQCSFSAEEMKMAVMRWASEQTPFDVILDEICTQRVAKKFASMPVEKPASTPAEKPAEKPASTPAEKPAGTSAEIVQHYFTSAEMQEAEIEASNTGKSCFDVLKRMCTEREAAGTAEAPHATISNLRESITGWLHNERSSERAADVGASVADSSANGSAAAAATPCNCAEWDNRRYADSMRVLASMRTRVSQAIKLLNSAQSFKQSNGRRQAIIDLSIAEIGVLLTSAAYIAQDYREEYEYE